MKDRNLIHSDQWQTPPVLYKTLDDEFDFDFDLYPLFDGEINEQEYGLLIEWGERNFINPPYSRKLKDAFVKRAVEESKKGKLCVLLLPVSTSTALFHEQIKPNAKEIRFLKGCVKFIGVNTLGGLVNNKAVMHDSMIVIMNQTNAE